jgi:HEAT repeat protein
MSNIATVVFIVLFAVAAAIGAVTPLVRVARHVRERRRARRAVVPRRALLALAADGADPEELVRMPAADWRAVEPTAYELLGKVRGEARVAMAEVFLGRGLVERARRDLRRRGVVRRARAAGALGSLGDRPAVPDLCRLLEDPHLDVQVTAVHALGRVGDPAACGPLIASLATSHPTPSQLVANSLAQIGRPAVPDLIKALDDPSPLVRTTALDALRLLGAAEAEERVAEVLHTELSLEVRLHAVAALGRFGGRAAVAPLLAAADTTQPTRLRAAAARALGELGALAAVPPLRALLSSSDYWVAHEAAGALLAVGSDGAAALAEAATGSDRAAAHAREALALAELERKRAGRPPREPVAPRRGA